MIELIPLHRFSDMYTAGWRLVRDCQITADDSAAVMISPNHEDGAPIRYYISEALRKNRMRNRAEPGRVAEVVSRKVDDVTAAMGAYKLTPAEASVFVVLVNRGLAEHSVLEDAAFSDDAFEEIENPILAIRTYVKRMRKKIRPHGIEIETLYGVGYGMAEECRQKAKRGLKTWRDSIGC